MRGIYPSKISAAISLVRGMHCGSRSHCDREAAKIMGNNLEGNKDDP